MAPAPTSLPLPVLVLISLGSTRFPPAQSPAPRSRGSQMSWGKPDGDKIKPSCVLVSPESAEGITRSRLLLGLVFRS